MIKNAISYFLICLAMFLVIRRNRDPYQKLLYVQIDHHWKLFEYSKKTNWCALLLRLLWYVRKYSRMEKKGVKLRSLGA